MSSLIISLPASTVSSGGTIADPVWDVSDARSIAVYVGASGPPPPTTGIPVEVAFSVNSTIFVPLLIPWRSNTSASVPALVTSSGATILEGVSFSKMRFVLDTASTDTLTVRGSKQVYI